MTHIGSPNPVVFGPNSMEISDISTGNIIVKGVENHAYKVYEFSHFLPYLAPIQSQQPLIDSYECIVFQVMKLYYDQVKRWRKLFVNH